ncbi:hypothetical protein FRACYDRAFT_220698 [Fragilariopsis cylindrus CCMP1102]|uniref:Uncharacterized protein n=1 Tax=Fragilariopsis cylindrus CCMP1102 TaxID=635003 RepID=A0A1E7EU48_9STRA|nr:hypothetical protein FRACYDRAFT_220698 [Fragilariopsis cylindrus CCMP1102]|eukprot:OEU09073.1 hypothetical protein FRACYDRAFT_220698 [Fragilariopsis cylindrus CCMP1102]
MDFDVDVIVVIEVDVVGKNEDSFEIDWLLFMFRRIKNRGDDSDDRENRDRDIIDCCCCCCCCCCCGNDDGGDDDDDDSNE